MPSRPTSLACAALASLGLSCSVSSANDDSYYSLRAALTTGKEGSDGDVTLCWTSLGEQTCHELSSGGNDFESGAKQTFDVPISPRVAHGTPFTSFRIEYRTGLSLGDTWEPVGLKLTRYYADGKAEPICDVTFDQTLSNGAVFAPPGCP